jgi:ribosomal protein L21
LAYAVIKTGGKQYRIQEGGKFDVGSSTSVGQKSRSTL